MVTVSTRLINSHLKNDIIRDVYEFMESDRDIQGYLKMSNKMVVDRLNYNDHGPVHARITAGSSLEIFNLLIKKVKPTTVSLGICNINDAKIITMVGSYLHDVGNCVHRKEHIMHGCYLAAPILDRIYGKFYQGDPELAQRLKTETLHCIYAHDDSVEALSIEAGAAKVGDGTDMAEGRARIPYSRGRVEMHSISALSIKKVEIEAGEKKPVKIKVHMTNPSGVYQLEEVIGRKISTSGIQEYIEIVALENGVELKTMG